MRTATAVVVALAAMFGTGLYAALAPAAAFAGVWFPLAVVLAGLLALTVVASTAHLTTARPAGPELVRGDLPAPALRLGAIARLVSRTAAPRRSPSWSRRHCCWCCRARCCTGWASTGSRPR